MATAEQPQTSKILDEIVSLLKENNSFLLSGHKNPDADVIGSELALASLIRRLGKQKKIDIINCGNPPASLSNLSGYKNIQSAERVDGEYDVIVVFECSGMDRMGSIVDLRSQGRKIINIDHHLHNPMFGHVNLVEPKTSSTAELIYKIFNHADIVPSLDEAVCIYTGIVADTGWFRYSNTNPQTHQIVEKLLSIGVPVAKIGEQFYMSRTLPAMRLLGWVLTNLSLHHNDRIALLTIPEKIYNDFGAQPDDVEEIVNYGLKIQSVCASALLKEKKGESKIKVSLRSKEIYDINQVAREFGGGGHKNASGCELRGPLSDAQEKILSALKKIF